MRVAIFSSTIDVRNGYGNITFEYCSALCKNGIDFVLFLPKSEKKHIDTLSLSFDVSCTLPEYIFRIRPYSFFSYLKIMDVSSFDIVHSLFSFPYCFIAARAAKRHKIPFLMGAQGTYGVLPLTQWPEKYFLKWSYKQALQIIVPSEFTKEYIQKYAEMKYPISVIHNGVDFNRFQVSTDNILVREKYKGKKILLTVGGLKDRKGQDLVIRALPAVIEKFPNVVYVLVGEGSIKKSLLQLARDLNVETHVDFVGSKTSDELVEYFKMCDIYVHTSRVIDFNFEGFGIVYLEASACKKPLIATDAGGIRDAVIHEKTGLVVGNEDIGGISKAACRLLSDVNFADGLGEAGYQYAKLHDWSNIFKRFIKLYELYAKR